VDAADEDEESSLQADSDAASSAATTVAAALRTSRDLSDTAVRISMTASFAPLRSGTRC
jgi:hypothetical protein